MLRAECSTHRTLPTAGSEASVGRLADVRLDSRHYAMMQLRDRALEQFGLIIGTVVVRQFADVLHRARRYGIGLRIGQLIARLVGWRFVPGDKALHFLNDRRAFVRGKRGFLDL